MLFWPPKSGRVCKFGVQPNHFYRERDFVDYALAGAMTTAEQLDRKSVV